MFCFFSSKNPTLHVPYYYRKDGLNVTGGVPERSDDNALLNDDRDRASSDKSQQDGEPAFVIR
jgi:hypothetical protein